MKPAAYTASTGPVRLAGQTVPADHLPYMAESTVSDRATIEAIVRSAATGDEMAFARLVAQHHASMTRVAYVICGDSDGSRDAVQSAWAIAWQRLTSLRDATQVRAWLVAIAANEARQAVRRRRRTAVLDISGDVALVAGNDVGEAVDIVDLRHVLAALSNDERMLLAMRFAGGLDSREIARQLGISASGVRSRLARLLDRLRTDLALEQEAER